MITVELEAEMSRLTTRSHSWRWRRVASCAAGCLTACALGTAAPAGASTGTTGAVATAGRAEQDCLQPVAGCYAPRPFRSAYGIQGLLDRGIDGRGQTVVLPELANQPPASPPGITDIRQDLARFDSLFGLPAVQLQVVTTLARPTSPYLAEGEEVEDVEIVHAIAPGAAIVVDLVPSTATATAANFATALTSFVRLGLTQGDVISISGSVGEHFATHAEVTSIHSALQAARDHHVTVVASSGDTGAVSDLKGGSAPVKELSLPASDPLVLSVGGTSLDANPATGEYYGEMAWNNVSSPGDDDASGGGFSHLFARPSYQDGTKGTGATRGVPDVAADADAATGMALAMTAGGQNYVVVPARGTSAATPLWAAVVALADQYAGRHLGFVDAAIYRVGRSPGYRYAFHDITAGDNSVILPSSVVTGYQATSGWDPVTGWGSPDAQVLVPLLARAVRSDDGAGL